MPEHVDLNAGYRLEKILLTYQGFYPMKDTPWWYYPSRYIHSIIFILLSLTLVLYVFFTTGGDLVKLCENLLFFFAEFAFICKLLNIVVLKDRLWLLEDHLNQLSQIDYDAEEKAVIEGSLKKARIIIKIYRWLCFLAVLFFALVPLIDQEEGERKLPLALWVPFDQQKYYFFAWFYSILSLSVGAFTNSNIDILTMLYITIGTSQFEVLKGRFSSAVEFVDGSNEVDETAVKARLRECVIYYDAINRYIDDVDETFSIGIFCQFACSAVTICMTGFQLVIVDIYSVGFILTISYFGCMMCQIVTYCWTGNRLIQSSDELSNACYSSKWYECSASVQKIITIIMERAKVPVKLRAAGFFSVSLPTLMGILRTSYSYFAVLRHVYITLYVNRE